MNADVYPEMDDILGVPLFSSTCIILTQVSRRSGSLVMTSRLINDYRKHGTNTLNGQQYFRFANRATFQPLTYSGRVPLKAKQHHGPKPWRTRVEEMRARKGERSKVPPRQCSQSSKTPCQVQHFMMFAGEAGNSVWGGLRVL